MKRGTRVLAILIFLIFSALSAHAEPGERKILKTTLDNGLTVILEEDHSAKVAAFQMWVRVGSADESADEAGIAHVFEHMLFKGTEKRGIGEIAREVEGSGGYINAYTSYDNTVYHLVVDSSHFSTGLDIISDAVQNSSFDPDELDKELEVVLEELRMGEDNPGRKLFKTLLAASYTTHPYGRPVIGFTKTVNSLDRGHILEFFDKWYRPNNMTLVIVGDFEIDEALKEVRESFKDFEPGENIERKRPAEPEQGELRTTITPEPVKQAQLGIAFHIPEQKHPDIYAIDVASVVLGYGVTSRLYKRLKVENELVNSVSTYAMTPKEPGVFLITATLDTENVDPTITEVVDILSELAADGTNRRELEKAKLSLESDFIYSRETMQGKASQLGYYETISGDLEFEKKYLDGIRSVKGEDVARIASQYLDPRNMSVSVIAPEEEEQSVSGAAIASAVAKGKRAYAERAKETKEAFGEGEVTKVELDNGMTLLVKQDHSNETVAFYATFPGGLRYETTETNGLGNMMAAMLRRGTTKRTREDIAREAEDIAASINGFSARNTAGVSARTLSKHYYKGLSLFADMVKNPSFPEDELEKLRKDVLAAIERDEDYLPGYTFKLLYKELYGEHPYSMPIKGTVETVSGFTREDLAAHHERIFAPERMILSVVGDVNTEEVIESVKESFRDFERSGGERPVVQEVGPVEGIVVTGDRKQKEQTNIGIGFIGTTIDDKDKYPLSVLMEVLGSQGGRLFVELRDKKSLAYAVSAFSREGVESGMIGFYIGCAPAKKEEAIEGILHELKKVTTTNVTAEELERASNAIVGGFEIGLQEVMSQASSLSTDEALGLGYDHYKRFVKEVKDVSRRDVRRVARKYLTLDDYVVSIVGPNVDDPDDENGDDEPSKDSED